ncbi:MAG: uroporphyrinogen-III C-methyltransferase [bacterium]|nr:uroporphyrinogen-III C-methyltransferase [bacterium]
MEYLPINIDLRGRKVIVTGGITGSARKVDLALRAGAKVTVHAQKLGPDFHELVKNRALTHVNTRLCSDELTDVALIFAACEEVDEDKRIFDMARAAGVLVNVPDKSELCDFIMPAILDRSPLVISVSSGGASPILARVIKARLETLFPAAYGQLASFVSRFRDDVMDNIKSGAGRLRFWEKAIDGPVADMALSGDLRGAEEQMRAELKASIETDGKPLMGEVYVVGAGPGDPDLLTFKALRLIQRADVVLYDRLIGKGLLNLVRRDAERIYVGKLPKDHIMHQEEITKRLVEFAKQGKRVLRLKGGDPFIFGRGGEEIEMLAEHGVPFQVVPGVTAAAGCSSYAGIPLTHRDHAQCCIFVTGHGKDGKVDLDWEALIKPHQTVAIYMGLAQLAILTSEFIGNGADRDLPVAVIDNGTRHNQRVIIGTLSTIADKVKDSGIEGPAVTIVGTVVTLHDKLKWFMPEKQSARAAQSSRDAIPAHISTK